MQEKNLVARLTHGLKTVGFRLAYGNPKFSLLIISFLFCCCYCFSFHSYNFKTPIKINKDGSNRINNVELKKIPRNTRKNPRNVNIASRFMILFIKVFISCFLCCCNHYCYHYCSLLFNIVIITLILDMKIYLISIKVFLLWRYKNGIQTRPIYNYMG